MTQKPLKYKLYLVRTPERALYDDEQVLMGIFDSLDDAARVLGNQFQYCDIVTTAQGE